MRCPSCTVTWRSSSTTREKSILFTTRTTSKARVLTIDDGREAMPELIDIFEECCELSEEAGEEGAVLALAGKPRVCGNWSPPYTSS